MNSLFSFHYGIIEPSSDHGKFSTTTFTFCFSTAHATPVNFSSTELVMFQLKISKKLDEKNFLMWLQQIEPVVNAHNLSSFLYYIEILEKFIRDSVTSAIVANPAHRLWIRQDQWILSWLQSTISSSIMTGISGCVHVLQLWKWIHDHFQKLTRARAPPHRLWPHHRPLSIHHYKLPILLVLTMQTRLKTGVPLPKLLPSVFLIHIEPHTVKQALKDPKWKAIGCKWVFRLKENADGTINKYKVRLVAKGFHQLHGFVFHETFSSVIKLITIKLVLTLALTHHWSIQLLDINNAFLNGYLDDEVYVDQPPGFTNGNSSLVCKLNKALYGLKQAPRQWFVRPKHTLISFKFVISKCHSSLFTYSSNGCIVYILVYVDDIIITSNSSSLITSITNKLNSAFALKQLGNLDYFLGIEVKPQPNGCLLLSQGKHIRDLLNKVNMIGASPVHTHMVSTSKFTKTGSLMFTDPTL
ncbi:retrovirus-related Pol polyprotein from transposon TNT 1-94 [Trifolium medium]|uniref:Retrovirus-related Pol polyprotein from transposon TNT 1-94 n=1 Tax=Trifolium medium TaxID=97028 RepID=A0A392M4K6_9FABA|nr:retrovirus-related Pol polyprotein from transposon TNT 1-94 [Trifolium medium]